MIAKLTVNDHGAGGDGLFFDGGDFTTIDAAEFVGRFEYLESPVSFVRVVGRPIVQIETAFEEAQILRPLARYPLVDGTRSVLKIPLNDQFRFLIG